MTYDDIEASMYRDHKFNFERDLYRTPPPPEKRHGMLYKSVMPIVWGTRNVIYILAMQTALALVLYALASLWR